jgi:hypothetical protein
MGKMVYIGRGVEHGMAHMEISFLDALEREQRDFAWDESIL